MAGSDPTGSSTLVQNVSEILSGSVICLCVVLKVPQIYNVLSAGTCQGLNLKSVLLEFWCYTVFLTYNLAQRYPLSAYLEYFLLNIQDVVILFLIFREQKKLNFSLAVTTIIYTSFAYSVVKRCYPAWFMTLLMTSVTPVAASSKLIQLLSIVREQDPGQVSALTWGIASYAATARCFTTLVQTGDLAMLAPISISAVLNLSILMSVLYYRNVNKSKKE